MKLKKKIKPAMQHKKCAVQSKIKIAQKNYK